MMKKLVAFLFVAGTFTAVGCTSANDEAVQEPVEQESVIIEEEGMEEEVGMPAEEAAEDAGEEVMEEGEDAKDEAAY